MKKTEVKLNKPVHLGLSILDVSKTGMYEFWYDYTKPKYRKKAKLCYMDTDSFIVHVKSLNVYEDLTGDVETRLNTSNHEVKRPLPLLKSIKIIRIIKDELCRKIKKEIAVLKSKMYLRTTS